MTYQLKENGFGKVRYHTFRATSLFKAMRKAGAFRSHPDSTLWLYEKGDSWALAVQWNLWDGWKDATAKSWR